ncbi:MAG: glycosyltransferase [Solirubrobacteraceae bacterium]|nr:glycosyltransferase [Solirubrobacteraceae bacterium]
MTDAGPVRLVNIVGAAEGADWFAPMCAGLAARGHDVRAIIDARPGAIGAQLAQAGIPVDRLDLSLSRPLAAARGPARGALDASRLARAAGRVTGVLRRVRPDVVLTHHFNATLLGRLAGAAAGVPLRLSMAPSPFTLEAPVTRALDRATWRANHVVIAGSERVRSLYEAIGVPRSRLEVVYYGAPAERFDPRGADRAATRARLGVPAYAPLIGHVAHFYAPIGGRFAPPAARGRGVKGHEVLLRALPAVLAERPDARLVCAGGARGAPAQRYRERIGQLAEALGVAHAVDLLDERDDVPQLLGALDVSVQPSLAENLGGTIESLLMAAPTVASRVGGMPEAVRHEETGLLVAPDRPDELAAAIARLLAAPDLAARLGRQGRELMLQRFTFERTVADLDGIIRARHAERRGTGRRAAALPEKSAFQP